MKRIKQFGAFLSLLFLTQLAFAQAGSTFTNPMTVSSLPYVVTGDSTCGYGDNYTTSDIACTGFYMNGDEKIYSFTPASNIASFNVEMTNISDTYSGIFITDDSTTSGNCLGDVGNSTTATRGVYNVSLVSGTTYYIIVSTWATPQCISSFDINMYTVSCPDPSSLSVSDITYDSVSLSWTENGSATSWIIEWDTNGFALGTGNSISSTSNPDTLIGLNPVTDYSYYVRALCGPGDTSGWSGPYNFTTLPTCPAPSGLGASNISLTSADLDWTENGSAAQWQVEWDTSGFSQGNGTMVLSSANPYALTGLTGQTNYEFYVRAICGAGDSSTWVGPYLFYTGHCIPNPSSVDGDGIIGVVMDTINNVTGAETGNYGDYSAMIAVAPQGTSLAIDITLSTGYTYNLWAWVDWNDDLDFDDAGEEYYLGESSSSDPTTYNASIAIPLTAALGNHRIRLGGADSGLGSTSPSNPCYTGSYASFEDYTLLVAAPPACFPPTALTATNISSDSADLGWTENGTATTWDIEWDTTGFTQGTGTMVTGTTSNPTTVSALTANTSYEFYVRADCGSNSSTWVGPYSFATLCSPMLAPTLETFDGNSTPDCWSQTAITGGPWVFSGTPGWGSAGAVDHTGNGGSFAWMDQSGSDAGVSLISNEIDVTNLTTAYLEFYYYTNNTNNTDTNDLIVEAWDGSAWQVVDSLHVNDGGWTLYGYDVSSFTYGTNLVQIRFRAESGGGSGDYYQDPLLDDIAVYEMPTCFAPTALTVNVTSYSTADLGWTDNGPATLWEYEFDTTGFTQGTGTMDTTSLNPVSISGLLSETTYQFYVRAVCGAADSSNWTGPFSFTTPPSCPAPDTLEVTNITLISADLSWSEMGSATLWEFEYDTAGFTQGLGTMDTTSTNPYSVTGLTAFTNYEFYVRAICGAGDSSVWVGPFPFYTGYCNPNPSSVDGSGITNVTMGSINNTTSTETGNYGDYSSMVAVTAQGSTFAIDITLQTGYTYNLWAWVDWNNDLDFDDAGEEFYLGESTSANPTTYSGSIVVPMGASIGNHRIRLGGADSGLGSTSPSNPCYSGSYGSFEDYTLDIVTPLVLTSSIDSSITCNGMSNGVISVTASGGSTPYSYVWSNGDTTMSTDSLAAGIYYVTVNDSVGQEVIDTITLTEPMPVVVNLGNDTSLCMGDSVIFNAGTFSAYLWDDASTMATRTAYATMAGPNNYWVEVTDTNGCTGSDTVVVTTMTPINPDLGMDTAICFSESVTLDAGTGFTSYSWDDATSMQTRLVDGTTEGAGMHVYFVSTVDMNGCNGSDTINVAVDAEIIVDLGSDTTVCNGEKITLDAGVYSSYMWDDNSTMQTRDVIVTTVGATMYDVTVTTAVGCTGNSSITITGLAPVVVDLGSDTSIIWFGSDTIYTLDAGAGFTGYLWSDGTTNQTNDITLANSGNVIVVVTDANGCTGSDTVLVDFILSVSTFEVASLKMYPNPADNQVNIELSNFKNVHSVNITFLSITGKVVLTKNVQVSGNSYFESFDVSSLATGTYFVQFEANGEVITKQFVIK